MYNQNGPANPQGGNRPKKEIINQFQGTGILRSRKENEPLKFIPWKTGGVLNAYLKTSENIGVDEYGNPKVKNTSVPVKIITNKNITSQQLQSLVAGTKVHVVGRLELESWDDKQTNARRSQLVVNVYVLDILEVPMQNYQPGPQQTYYPGQPMPQQYPPQGQPQYVPNPPQGGQQPYYPGQPMPQPQYQGQPQYSGQQPVPQQYPPQGQPQYVPNQPQGGQQPPWYQPGVQEQGIDDLPPA